MITREKKGKIMEELTKVIKEKQNIIFTDFSGLTTAKINELKNNLRDKNIRYKVTKKSLWPIVTRKTSLEKQFNFSDHVGSVAIAYGFGEVNEIAKVITDFSNQEKELVILGGIFDNVFVSSEKIKELAKIGSREELMSRFVFILKNPLQSLVGVLGANIRDLVSIISNIKSNQE